nr:uncharacterized protein LOC129442535 isoform X2 [Misgurnus anguillicaudatus]
MFDYSVNVVLTVMFVYMCLFQMQIWKWLILSVTFVVTTSYCSPLMLQQKNQTEHLASETYLADITGYQQGHFENSSKAQGLHRNNPEFKAPLDPLSRSFVKVKKDKRRQGDMSQKQPGQKGSVEQMMPGESSDVKILKSGDKTQPADKVVRSPMEQPHTKQNGRTDILTFESSPSDRVRTRVSKKRGNSGTFGLPFDRIGHLSHRRG